MGNGTDSFVFTIDRVFLRMGWMNKGSMGDILKDGLDKKGIVISKADAALITKDLRKPMWQYHILSGYVLIAIYLIRAIITLFQDIAFANPFSKITSLKERLKSCIYIIFYILVAISLFTGCMILNGPKDMKEIMEVIHVKSLYHMTTLIIIYIAGVLIANSGEQPGIVSKIISGNN